MIDDISIHIIEIYRGTQDRKFESQVKTPGSSVSINICLMHLTQYRGVRVKMWGKLFKRTIASKCLELKISWWSEPTKYIFSPVGPCPLLPFLHIDSGLQMPFILIAQPPSITLPRLMIQCLATLPTWNRADGADSAPTTEYHLDSMSRSHIQVAG